MFDISELQKDSIVEKRLIVDCLVLSEGEAPPVVIVEISDKIRKEERRMNQKYNRFVIESKGKGSRQRQEGSMKSDRLGYAKAMTDLCVKDSQGLFSEGGQPTEHKNKLLKKLFDRYANLLDWFLDALTDALSDYDLFCQDEDERLEKN